MTDKKDRIELFETMPIPKAVVKMALPSVAASLVSILYNLADTYFVGLLNNADQSAAVSFASAITLALIAVQNLFGVGGSSYFGRCLGARKYDAARKTAGFAIWASIAFGLIYSVIYFLFRGSILTALGAEGLSRSFTDSYLFYTIVLGSVPSILNVVLSFLVRTEGQALHASLGAVTGCLLNIVLDPFFVLPQFLDMGVAGAGYATFISNCAACLYFFIMLKKNEKESYISFNPKNALPGKTIVKELCLVGVPAAIQNLLNVTGMFVLNNFASSYGSDAVAAAGISHKLFLVPLYITMSFSQASMPLLSYNYGAKNFERAKKSVVFTAAVALSLGILMMIGYMINPAGIVAMFIEKPEIVAFGGQYLRVAAVAVPLMTFDFMAVALYQAFGKGYLALILAIARKLILEIPAMIVMNRLIPFIGLAYAQPISEGVLTVAAFIMIPLLFKKLEKEEK